MSTHLIMFIHRNEGHLYSQGKGWVQTEGHHERGWIRTTINLLYRLFSAEKLASSSLYTSAEQDILNCMVDLAEESVLSLVFNLKDKDTGTNTQWCLYEPLESIIETTKTSADTPHVLVGNAMTPTAEREEDFNRWYNEEHILMLSRTPTWIQSTRHRLIDSNHDVPNYLALHKWGSRTAFESPQYEIATTTPWKFQVVDNVIARERHVYDYVGEMHVEVDGNVTVKLSLRFRCFK